jgi:transketolase
VILTDDKLKYLETKAREIRRSIISMLVEARSGHTAGALGMADIFTALYFGLLNHDPKRPDWEGRDRVVLSNGHICPVLYATLAEAGYFEKKELMTLRKYGSRLQGHPHREFFPLAETSSGPLGEGLAQAVGMALADRLDVVSIRLAGGPVLHRFFYCLMSDGELQEGSTWEAVMLAGKEKPHNLIASIDRNNIQIDGQTEDVMPLEPLVDKWRAFGWQVIEIDGHSFPEIFDAVGMAKSVFNRPSVIIAHTTPGKGVPEFENKFEWHGKTPTKEEGRQALDEIN